MIFFGNKEFVAENGKKYQNFFHFFMVEYLKEYDI